MIIDFVTDFPLILIINTPWHLHNFDIFDTLIPVSYYSSKRNKVSLGYYIYI